MGSAWNQLEQMLTCPICLDKFKNPRLLPCQHSFCGDSCMDGLVDYARRQIKCPECRAEHRIPYQGVSSLPINVTLIRFLELHSRITGDEPEPVPTFMEKCSVCGEKVEGVQRCAHCEKKACPECREAHVDILRREVGRINGQTKRCIIKMKDFRDQIDKAQERLKINHSTVKQEIQNSCRRLIDDLQAKQRKLIEEVDSYVEQENKTLEKLRTSSEQEYDVLDSNSRLAEEKIQVTKYQWTDAELWEMKDIYARAMEFIRLFDADLGDFNRKIRFMIIPEFDSMRKRICDLGELKFAESSISLMANAFQYCNATGNVAIEMCQSAAAQAAAQMSNMQGSGGYSLAHSNSNTNMVATGGIQAGGSGLLEIPSMQNALMRSQSDHRLASQFQQRLKQQQQQQLDGKAASRYGAARDAMNRDFDTDALRSRYAPPRSTVAVSSSAAKDYANDLTRDWPRPGDSDADGLPFGSSIQFKSAFMRRKGQSSYGNPADDDDDLASEASYGGGSRNVRFSEQNDASANGFSRGQIVRKLFECKELEHGPFSGVPKLSDCASLLTRLHQMGAKAVVDKKQAEEESRRDKELVESARQAMSQAANKLSKKASEDEIEKQKREIKQQQISDSNSSNNTNPTPINGIRTTDNARESPEVSSQRSATPTNESSRQQTRSIATPDESPSTPTQSSSTASSGVSRPLDPASRKSLYSQAITEKSKRQLANAIQEASSYSRRRASSSVDPSFDEQAASRDDESPSSTAQASSSPKSPRTKRVLRSSSRTMRKQESTEQLNNETGTIQRRPRRLNRSDSSQQQQSIEQIATSSLDAAKSKNSVTGSGGQSDSSSSLTADRSKIAQSSRRSPMLYHSATASVSTTTDQTSNTTDDDDNEEETTGHSSAAQRQVASGKTRVRHSSPDNDSDDDDRDTVRAQRLGRKFTGGAGDYDDINDDDNDNDNDDDDEDEATLSNSRARASKGKIDLSSAKRLSREFLPNAVNKLLDRSAQIRRDSQEQMSRGDSPQRTSYYGASSGTGAASSSYSSYSGSPSGSRGATSSSDLYGTPTSGSGISRHRYTYQRSDSQSSSQANRNTKPDDESGANSSNSIYTTASSQGSRKGSNDDEGSYSSSALARSRLSGNSSESTVVSSASTGRDLGLQSRRSGYSRQDSSGDSTSSPSGTRFQSRFLSRSRTASALASGNNVDTSADSAGEQTKTGADLASSYSNRSNLSSRDRFLQSANAAISGSSSGASGSSNLYSRSGSSTGKFTNILAWRARLRAHFNLSKN